MISSLILLILVQCFNASVKVLCYLCYRADALAQALTIDDATLISRYLALARPFSKAFDLYLSCILRVCDESAVALRTRAIKCLAEVVAVDPSIMSRVSIHINYIFFADQD